MSAVITIALPVFAVIALGMVAGRFKFASADDAAALNRFVYRFGFPAALFALMSSASGLGVKDGLLAFAYGAAAVFLMMTSYFMARRAFSLTPEDAGAHAFASTLGNAVFLGLPVAMAVSGWAKPFVTLMLVEGIVVIALGAALMAPRSKNPSITIAIRQALVRPLTNPLVVAALAGFLVALVGVTLPGPVRAFLDLVARAAGPVALFSLGLFFSTRPAIAVGAYGGKVAAIAAVKMAALPALSFVMLGALGVEDPSARGALALFTAVPTAVGAFVMATQYGRYIDETAAAIAATTALSVFSISAVLLFFA